MKSAVIVFPGSNCDRDMAVAIEKITGSAPAMIWHRDDDLPDVDFIALPGGFSYGDYLRCGAIASRSEIIPAIIDAARHGVPTLGICNGFQILTEIGLLPGALMRNAQLNFVCKDVFLRVENAQSMFTNAYKPDAIIRIPVAHHDGQYFADPGVIAEIENDGRVAFRYVTADGNASEEANPNGSTNNIAGILNQRGNVLGMMPHPERLFEERLGGTDGRGIFESLVNALAPA